MSELFALSELVVSVDQEICIACGLCSEIDPDHFSEGESGLAFAKEKGSELDTTNPKYKGFMGKVAVAAGHEDQVIDAAESCPVECINVEMADSVAAV